MSGASTKRAAKPRACSNPSLPTAAGWKPWLWFLGLAVLYLGIECFVPLATSIKLGTDEDFELSKTLLFLRGFHFYTEVWIDQPPLYTYLLAEIARHTDMAVLGLRLLTVALALLLLGSLFRLCLCVGNLRTAVLAVALTLAAPGFLELSSSCMIEVPVLSFVVAAFAWLSCGLRRPWLEIGAGILFGIAFQMKLIAVIYLPLTVLMLWLKHRLPLKQLILSAFVIGAVAVLGFVLFNLLTGCPLILQLQQGWSSHFAGAKSFEYGSPEQHAFNPVLLLRNWDVVVPAFLCTGFLLANFQKQKLTLFPAAWLVLSLAIVSTHRPWWACYYLHNDIPLCWCAAIAVDAAVTWASSQRTRIALVGGYLLVAGVWMGGRSYLEVMSMRRSPRLFNSPVLSQIERYKPYVQYLFSTDQVYSFHSGIPLPPHLAEISLKRLWSGDMTNEKLAAELAEVKPGLILVANQSRELPYQNLLQAEYRMVYEDAHHQLYVSQSVIAQATQSF